MIEIKNLTKTFQEKKEKTEVLKNISCTIEDGDIFGIIGMSGAGKSTLVRCINLLEIPTSGDILIDGKNLINLKKKELRNERKKISMIFQNFNLLMQKNCLNNVVFPLKLIHMNKKEREKRALELLDIVSLKDKAYSYPSTLSGGQKQRVAIARALATNPNILLCDEATSALDPDTTKSILALLKKINQEMKVTIIIITHQMNVIESICNKVAIIENGEIVESGNVEEIFTFPKSKTAKKLVYSDIDYNSFCDDNSTYKLRIIYNGIDSTSTPLITKLALDKKIYANIIYASTKNINDKLFGNMIIQIKKEELQIVKDYFSIIENVTLKEVNENAFSSSND